MDNSIYIALSKQTGLRRELDVIANNLANSNTAGYQSEQMTFKSHLIADVADSNAFAYDVATIRDYSQGTIDITGNKLDFAIEGRGYFAVQTDNGIRYTRAGNFTLDIDGALATQDGHKVLDDGGAEIEFEEDDNEIVIFSDGRLEVDGEERATLGVYLFDDENSLTREGSSLYSTDSAPTLNEGQSKVAQGALERSNVASIREITNMIKVQRAYTGNSSFIENLYQLQEDAVRRIASQV